MTVNAYIFSWDQLGIEAIVPISKYEKWDAIQTMEMLKGNKRESCPLTGIVSMLMLRARFNTHRHYEIYAVDCDEGMTEDMWREQWESCPQQTADLIRQRGLKLLSNRTTHKTVIT